MARAPRRLGQKLFGGMRKWRWRDASIEPESFTAGEYLAQLNEDALSAQTTPGADALLRATNGTSAETSRPRIRWFQGIREDQKRRAPHYLSDWTDGFSLKSVSAVLFLLPAVLMPAVAFGVIADLITGGAISVPGYVASCGIAGMLYSVLCGQPMTFIGPTGLTLAFMVALHGFCTSFALPFLAMYAWVGTWTAGFLFLLAAGGAPALIRYCTQFTDDIFNSLLALNFIFDACATLLRSAGDGTMATPLLSVNLAALTYVLVRGAGKIPRSPYGTPRLRKIVGDFGPPLAIIAVSLLCSLPTLQRFGIATMASSIPSEISLPAAGFLSQRFADMAIVPLWAKLGCALPAVFLTALFFLDQNISSRIVNSPRHKMRKGPAYNLDNAALSFITLLLSLTGLPWMCATTVQSLNHVTAMTDYAEKGEIVADEEGNEVGIVDTRFLALGKEGSLPSTLGTSSRVAKAIVETRVTGFAIHAGVLASLLALPLLQGIPVPVVSGIFFVLGRTVMSGNDFLYRTKELVMDDRFLPDTAFVKRVGRRTTLRYTAIQVACLVGLWCMKSCKTTALFFPSVIGVLVMIRRVLLPKLFRREELAVLDRASS